MGVVAKCLIPQDTHGKAQDSTPYSRKQTLDQAHGGAGFPFSGSDGLVVMASGALWLSLLTIPGQQYLHKVLINNYVTKSMVLGERYGLP